MSVDRIISTIALGLAGMSICMMFTKNYYILCASFIMVCIVVIIMYRVERALKDSQGEFLNKCFFYFSKNKDKYIERYEEACYQYLSKNEMEYSKKVDVISKGNNLDKIEQKYSWSSYSGGIKVEPMYSEQEINFLAAQNVWTRFEILFNKRLAKKEVISTGFRVVGLVDGLGISKPFLSLSTDNKVQERKMIVKIPRELKPLNCKFEIYLGGPSGRVLKSEPLEYDKSIGGYQKSINYPRRGWTYSIIWEWEENG